MTFVPPTEPVTGPNPADQTVVPGNIIPQSDHPGFTDQEWAEIQQNLDGHYRQLYGPGPDAGSPSGQAGTPLTPPADGLGNQTPVAGVPVTEYDLGAVKIPVEDASSLGALYTFIRNNPDKATAILDVVNGQQQPVPQQQVPIWQQQPTPPQYTPPFMQQFTPPPPQGGVQIVPPDVLETMDPASRYMYDRMNQIGQQQDTILQTLSQQRQVEAQRQAEAQTQQRVQRDTANGITRFRQAHREITDEQFAAINSHAQGLGILGGLLTQLPGDQAVARAFELARLDLGSSLTGAPLAPTVPADVQRQATLTSLAGGSSGSVPRQEPTAPVDTSPDPDLNRAKKAAVEMLKQSGINLADNL